MIVKVQIPLNSEGGPLLIYTEGKAQQWLVWPHSFDPELLKQVRSDCKAAGGKAYYRASGDAHAVAIEEKVEDQSW